MTHNASTVVLLVNIPEHCRSHIRPRPEERGGNMYRLLMILGVIGGILLAFLAFSTLPNVAPRQVEQVQAHREAGGALPNRQQHRVLMQPPTGPIYTAEDALDRVRIGHWPPDVTETDSVVRLLTDDTFRKWMFGSQALGISDPVWVVAMTAEDATLSQFGFDGSDNPVAGFWYEFEACSGEPGNFGGLSKDRFDSLALLPNENVTITPCETPTPGSTVAPPW